MFPLRRRRRLAVRPIVSRSGNPFHESSKRSEGISSARFQGEQLSFIAARSLARSSSSSRGTIRTLINKDGNDCRNGCNDDDDDEVSEARRACFVAATILVKKLSVKRFCARLFYSSRRCSANQPTRRRNGRTKCHPTTTATITRQHFFTAALPIFVGRLSRMQQTRIYPERLQLRSLSFANSNCLGVHDPKCCFFLILLLLRLLR